MHNNHHFECNDCGAVYPGDQVIYLCPACAGTNLAGQPARGILKTIYDYTEIQRAYPDNRLRFSSLRASGFLPLLPVANFNSWPNLKIGQTPLYRVEKLSEEPDDHLPFRLFLKDDSQNPTFSFKDRASALVSAWAKEHTIEVIVAASTGNAGSSLAGICAAQRQKAVIVVPSSAPIAKLAQILMYGARLIPVRGVYDDAFDLSIKISEKLGWYNRNTAFNPLTIEGKKTVSFELFEELGQQLPDRIFVPVGDGVILSGVYKGFEDLLNLGIIHQIPKIVAVQAAGSPNVANNLDTQTFVSTPSRTMADSISVDIPRNFYMTRNYLKTYAGECLVVTDEEILKASLLLSRSTGIFSEPAAVAAFAGMMQMKNKGLIPADSANVVLLTGSGLKDPGATRSLLKMPEPVDPDISAIDHLICGL